MYSHPTDGKNQERQKSHDTVLQAFSRFLDSPMNSSNSFRLLLKGVSLVPSFGIGEPTLVFQLPHCLSPHLFMSFCFIFMVPSFRPSLHLIPLLVLLAFPSADP